MKTNENKGGCHKGRKKNESSNKKEKGGCLIGKKGVSNTELTREELSATLSNEVKLKVINSI